MGKKITIFATTILFLVSSFFVVGAKTYADDSLTLFTPYTGLSVTPGETIDYDVQVFNNSSSVQAISFSVDDLPEGWEYLITANGKAIGQLSVFPNSEEQINVEVTVPLEVDKADYSYELVAEGSGDAEATLPFLTTVTEKGTYETQLTTDQPNMEGHADSNFSYTAKLQNRTAEEQNYSLSSNAPEGWNVQFKANGSNVTSVSIEPNSSETITIDVTPANNVKADTYEIPIQAATNDTSAEVTLEAVITGSYDMQLTTPNGLLSTDVTAGGDKTVDLVIKNTGTAKLTNINVTASTPPGWETEFDNSTINELEAGDSHTIQAKIAAPDDAIAGDYVVTFNADTDEAASEVAFRVSVGVSTAWGFMGVLIILGVFGGLFGLFKKYGRR